MNAFVTQVKQVWQRLSRVQRGLVLGTAVLIVLFSCVAIFTGSSTQWRTLGSGLSRKEAQKVLAKLDDADVPYRIVEGGSTIEVPFDRWNEVQTIVVQNDLLQHDSDKGFAKAFGLDITATKSQQEFKRLIALQDELEMAIMRQEGIEDATVYITPAKHHWTKEGSQGAKASVMLDPTPGHLISAHQVESIVRFVAGAVKELDAESVVVTDTRGLVLARPEGADRPVAVAAGLAQARSMRLQGAAEEALERVFGRDKVVVRCNVELDMEQVRVETDGFLPDSQVVQTEKIRATENSKPLGKGTVSTSAVQAGTAAGSEVGSKTEDTDITYAHGKKREVRIKEVGAVKNLAVSVLADESLKVHTLAIESIVKGAVGYRSARGDTFGGVQFVPFAAPIAAAAPAEPTMWETGFAWELIKWSITGVIGLAFVAYLALTARRAKKTVGSALARIAEEETDERRQLEVRPDPKDELKELVHRDVGTVGKLLRNWMYEPAGSSS